MRRKTNSQSGVFTPRFLVALALCSCGVLLGLLSLTATPLASGAASGWSIVHSPNPPPKQASNYFNGVTCVSASDCWAVGYYVNGEGYKQTLVERWNGITWSIIASPSTTPTRDNFLQAVTCVSASDCWAVGASSVNFNGYTKGKTLTMHWDGTAWAIVASPNSMDWDTLADVTCTSTSNCWAVGYNRNDYIGATLIMHWDGAVWAIVNSPNVSVGPSSTLSGVTCVSATDCWAVGKYRNSSNPFYEHQTLVEHWDGTGWDIVASPNTSPVRTNSLIGVTCTSASNCWAVGSHYVDETATYKTLAERWDGTAWTIVTSPSINAAQYNTLLSVTCASVSDCWATGYYRTGAAGTNTNQTLVERWNGTSWTIVSSPNINLGATQSNYLFGIACAPAGAECWAVGNHYTIDGGVVTDQTLAERWDGAAWAIVTSSDVIVTKTNFLNDVTCISESNCWAVGYYTNGSNSIQTLIEHWDGAAWNIVNSPSPSATQNYLNDVTCSSASDCWVVGYYHDGSGFKSLIERWNGTAWAAVTSPNPAGSDNSFLYGVTCASASDCWAVGQSAIGSLIQTLIEHWDGTAWSITPSLNASTTTSALNDVTCASASNCMAVGHYTNAIGIDQTLIEHWNGVLWTIDITAANTDSMKSNVLNSVTCTSASDCWAVGEYINNTPLPNIYQTLVEHWNGTSWAIVGSPNSSATQDNFLNGIMCVSTSDCWGVGHYINDGSTNQTLIEHWDGISWALVPSPDTLSTQNNTLNGVACASPSACWAVGYYGGGETLVLRYPALAAPTPTSVVSRKTHGTFGSFDVDLPLTGNPGIECRSGGASGSYQLVVTFPNAVTFLNAAVTSGTGIVSNTSGGTAAVTLNLTGVTSAQTITLTLSSVNDGANVGDVDIRMGVLLGDVNANKTISNADVASVQAQVGATVTQSNFRNDVNANGTISNGDVAATQAQVGAQLSP
jgi:hypothetical protein